MFNTILGQLDLKKVKPIYFTQFPKDLDEIKNTKLKKEPHKNSLTLSSRRK